MDFEELIKEVSAGSGASGLAEFDALEGLTASAVAQSAAERESTGEEASLSILLIDDDPVDQRLVKRAITKADAGMVCTAVDGIIEASACLATQKFDVVLLDFLLRDAQKGPEHIAELKETAQDAHLPIIVLTGYGDEERVAEAFRDGASDYLSKKRLSAGNLSRAMLNSVDRAKLQRANDQNKKTILQANQLLHRQNKQISAFYQTVSHELKSPLTGAREYAALVKDGVAGNVNEQQSDLLNSAVKCCDTLKLLIDDLVDTAASENGKLSIHRTECNLADIAKECVARYEITARHAGQELISHIPDDLPLVYGDSLRLQQLLSNLLGNAIKYSGSGGSTCVSLYVDCESSAVCLSVADSGIGMDESHLSAIFDKFYQVEEASASSNHGMGLGLYLCRSIVELHGGQMSVQSAPGCGTEFRVFLPTNDR